MGFFSRNKEAKPKLSQTEIALAQANKIFKDILLDGEVIIHAVSGKSAAENLIFSVGILGATDKRLLYYYQDGSDTGKETILYDKIVAISQISGFEMKMGNYIGIAIELANGLKRIVRCIINDDNKRSINELVFYIEGKR